MKKYLRFIIQPLITGNFTEKLQHNFHTLTPFEMLVYFLLYRPYWSKERRFYFEGSLGLLGQMYSAERKVLYETITQLKPRQCYEIGTFTGGGSTYFISKAFSDIGSGLLITMESDTHYYNKAVSYFAQKLPEQNKCITFVFNDSTVAFDKYIPNDGKVDCVFFDGAEDGDETLRQFKYFEPYFKSGSIIMFHDWNTEKTIAIKPIILENTAWKKCVELIPPQSVGLAVFTHT